MRFLAKRFVFFFPLQLRLILLGTNVVLIIYISDASPSKAIAINNGGVVGGGVITLLPGDGIGEVPQLRVDYAGTYAGNQGGINGSVAIFDINVPNANNSLSLGPVTYYWTACFASFGSFMGVTKATIWTQLEGKWFGASYLSPFSTQATVQYAYGNVNVTATFTYSSTSINHRTVICTDPFNCFLNAFQLFSTLSCHFPSLE